MGVLVAGMHRSGTSALAGGLRALGLAAGDEAALIPAAPGNPHGYHEVRDLVFRNEMLLQHLGGAWFAPPSSSAHEVAELADTPLRDSSAELFRARIPSDRPWMWKDPRLCLLLPFWRLVLDPPLAVTMILRSPLEVARSLQVRNGTDPDLGLALWEHYNRTAVHASAGLPTYVVDYRDLVEEAPAVMGVIAEFLRGAGVAPEAPDLDAASAAIVAPSPGELDSSFRNRAIPDSVAELYRVLLDARGPAPADLAGSLPPASSSLHEIFDEARRMGYESFKVRRSDATGVTARAEGTRQG